MCCKHIEKNLEVFEEAAGEIQKAIAETKRVIKQVVKASKKVRNACTYQIMVLEGLKCDEMEAEIDRLKEEEKGR